MTTETTGITETAERTRAPWGEATAAVIAWCDEYAAAHPGFVMTWTFVKQELTAKPNAPSESSITRGWKAWDKAQKAAKLSGAAPVAVVQVEPATVPDSLLAALADAWTVVNNVKDSACKSEIEAVRASAHGEVETARAERDETTRQNDSLQGECDRLELELAEASEAAAAELAGVQTTLLERAGELAEVKAELVKVQGAMAVQAAELAAAEIALGKAEASLTSSLANERTAHADTERALGDLATERGKSTQLADEVTAANAARTTAEGALTASTKTLQKAQQDLAVMTVDLAKATATASERQAQVAAAEDRAGKERERAELAADEARKKIAALDQELAALKATIKTDKKTD